MKVLLLCLSIVYGAQGFIVCPPDACTLVRCAAVTAENCNGVIKQNGGYCGCCDACQTYLAEGDDCSFTFLLGVPSTAQCGPGLHCNMHTHKCTANTNKRDLNPCALELAGYSSTHNGLPLLGAHKPVCDSDGYYQPKQCSGSQCYCVAKEGQTIQGYMANVWEAQHMTCQCARDQYEYMQTGLIGRLFYCTSDGNYQNYQCLGDTCHCTDSNGNVMANSPSVNIGQIDILKC
mmetsp:Transcript_11179/g.20785  ORF Transcript_11179/g.20785 Transcript_11179/m.20785 type:complete len:233 (+) Transcript_11179:206-904(+)